MKLISLNTNYAKSASESSRPSLWDGLKAAYSPCLGITGSNLIDYSGSRREGVLTGMSAGTDWTVGEYGYQLDFVGDGQYIDLPDYDLGGDKGTVVLWLKPAFTYIQSSPFSFLPFGAYSDGSKQFQIRYNGASSSRRYEAVVRGNFGNTMTLSNGAQYNSDAELQVWTCLAFTWDIGNSEFYLKRDGSLYGSDTVTSVTAWGGVAEWRLGDTGGVGTSWTGSIAECLVYDRVVSDPELKIMSTRPGVIYEKKRRVIGFVPVTGPGGSIPIFMNHYRQQGFA